MNEDRKRETIELGIRTYEFCLGPGGVFAVLDELQESHVESLIDSHPEDTVAREAAYYDIRAIENLRAHFQVTIRRGRDAQAEVDRLNKE